MDKIAKFEYQQNIEQYLEDKQVFETLEGLLKSLIVHKPEKPIEYLMEKLQKHESKWVGGVTEFRSQGVSNGTSGVKQKGNCLGIGRALRMVLHIDWRSPEEGSEQKVRLWEGNF
jgi:hypothetical protein